MKKTLSIVLALTMLFALCVPSFAAVVKDSDKITINAKVPFAATQSDSSAIIKTDTSALPCEDGYFSVEFPALTNIPWSQGLDSSTPLNCTLDSHLKTGKTLQVTVKKSAAESKMTCTDPAVITTLDYTVSDGSVNLNQPVTATPHIFAPKIDIAAAQWNQAVVGDYQDTLTVEVAVVAVVPAP